MNTLRSVRDTMLAASPEGRRLVDLYYSPHAVEALVIAFSNPRVRVTAYSLVQEVLPAIQSRIRGAKAGVDSGTIVHATELLAMFAREASPEFKTIIEALREDLVHGSLMEKLGFVRE
jgi:hypothetical protein